MNTSHVSSSLSADETDLGDICVNDESFVDDDDTVIGVPAHVQRLTASNVKRHQSTSALLQSVRAAGGGLAAGSPRSELSFVSDICTETTLASSVGSSQIVPAGRGDTGVETSGGSSVKSGGTSLESWSATEGSQSFVRSGKGSDAGDSLDSWESGKDDDELWLASKAVHSLISPRPAVAAKGSVGDANGSGVGDIAMRGVTDVAATGAVGGVASGSEAKKAYTAADIRSGKVPSTFPSKTLFQSPRDHEESSGDYGPGNPEAAAAAAAEEGDEEGGGAEGRAEEARRAAEAAGSAAGGEAAAAAAAAAVEEGGGGGEGGANLSDFPMHTFHIQSPEGSDVGLLQPGAGSLQGSHTDFTSNKGEDTGEAGMGGRPGAGGRDGDRDGKVSQSLIGGGVASQAIEFEDVGQPPLSPDQMMGAFAREEDESGRLNGGWFYACLPCFSSH